MLLMEKETITLDSNLFIVHKPFGRKKSNLILRYLHNFLFFLRFVELNVCKSI